MKQRGRLIVSWSLLLLCLICSCKTSNYTLPPEEELNNPLPEYLSFVAPEPESIYSINDFKAGNHYPTGVPSALDNGANRVCIELNGKPFLETGDYFALRPNQGEYFPDRVTGYVDGEKVLKDEDTITILGEYRLINEKGEVTASVPGPFIICWNVQLNLGQHIATIEVEKTSGERISYSWSFEITKHDT